MSGQGSRAKGEGTARDGVRFGRHGSGVRGVKRPLGVVAQGQGALGAPSAGLSLGRLLASRARLRLARRGGNNPRQVVEQEQRDGESTKRWLVRKASQGVAKECSFFVQTMGSTASFA